MLIARKTAFAAVRANISGADHSFWSAGFCSARLCWRGLAFSCFALPRRHCSTAGTAVGRQPERMADRLLRRVLSLIHLAALVLGSVSLSICRDRYGLWSDSRPARFSIDPLGTPAQRTLLYAEPLARSCHHVRHRSTLYLRLVARHAFRRQRSWR